MRLSTARSYYLALLFVSGLLVCFPATSQTTSTEILGTVTDSSGAVVSCAKVTLLRAATGERPRKVSRRGRKQRSGFATSPAPCGIC